MRLPANLPFFVFSCLRVSPIIGASSCELDGFPLVPNLRIGNAIVRETLFLNPFPEINGLGQWIVLSVAAFRRFRG